jgi:hypothetical protein
MKRLNVVLIAALVVGTAAVPAHAAKLQKGSSVVWIGLNGNVAQLIGPTTGAANTFESGELGVHAAFSHFLCDAWTVCISGGADVGKSEFNPASGTTNKFSSTSYNLRIGGDRYAFINDDVALYAGPGILYWSGRGKNEGSGDPTFDGEWPKVTQVGLNGRVGMYARLGSHYALFGHIGQVIATNSASDTPGKNSWWSNHHEGTVGLALDF